jgi:hypothetical protein
VVTFSDESDHKGALGEGGEEGVEGEGRGSAL